MAGKLRLISYNCFSLGSNANMVCSLLKKCDVLCLQETLVDENNSNILDNLDNEFITAYVPAYRKPDCFVGRSSGGLAILWRRAENIEYIPMFYDKRIMGLKVILPDKSCLLILNVYLICDYGNIDSLLEYKSTLADLGNILEFENFQEVIITGDFNADPNKGRFFNFLEKFSIENSLFISDTAELSDNNYTYISSNSACSTSWLDHILCSSQELISNIQILYGTTFYDHIPLLFDLTIPQRVFYADVPLRRKNVDFNRVDWDKVDDDYKERYAQVLDELCMEVFQNVLYCRWDGCRDGAHIDSLDSLYTDLLDCLSVASRFLPHKNPFNKKSMVVGWNYYCKDLYAVAREDFLAWHFNGRVRSGAEFEKMKSSRAEFKKALKFCKTNEAVIRKENLLRKFTSANRSSFWKEVSKIKSKSGQICISIDGNSDPQKIVSIFDEKYESILNDPSSQDPPTLPSRQNMVNNPVPFVTIENINAAIFDLNIGLGWDGIHAFHLKYAGPVFRNLLGKFLNKLIEHSFLPSRMIYGEIRPVIKSNVLGKHDSNNYRPVMNSSMFLKVLEYSIMPEIMKFLHLSNRQFGFRKDTGCLHAITMVKEVIFKYNQEGSNVHCTLIDLSKAFDRINKEILFRLLDGSGLNPRIVNIIRCMYDESYVNTLFNHVKGNSWRVGNGVRQGVILSPLLFGFYINSVIEEISSMPLGCSIMGYKCNILCYADDIICLAPSAVSLQLMIDKLSYLLSELCLTINVQKSNYILFKSKFCRFSGAPQISLNGLNMNRVKECKYLGVIISDNGDLGPEIDRVVGTFLKQFNGLYSKFNFANHNVLFYLFKSFTSSFYGIDTWFEKIKVSQLSKISVTYHRAIKRLCGKNLWDSNHEACETVGVPIFKHLLSKRLLCLWQNLCTTKNACMGTLKYFFRSNSFIFSRLNKLFKDDYNVDIMLNPLCAVLARIEFVQRNEPRSYYAQNL